MSDYRTGNSAELYDANGVPVGQVGLDGKEYINKLTPDQVKSLVSGDVPVTVAMVQANTPPAGGGASGYCSISDGDGSIYPRGWRLYWLSSGPYYTLADIRSLDGKVS